jgi:hypothetical protein
MTAAAAATTAAATTTTNRKRILTCIVLNALLNQLFARVLSSNFEHLRKKSSPIMNTHFQNYAKRTLYKYNFAWRYFGNACS